VARGALSRELADAIYEQMGEDAAAEWVESLTDGQWAEVKIA
jgi:hypothetical protein